MIDNKLLKKIYTYCRNNVFIGPVCDYDANSAKNKYGITWKEKQQERDRHQEEQLRRSGFSITLINMYSKGIECH